MALRLDGMRFLVSFTDCVGSLMTESGLVDTMSCAFRGVDHNVYLNKFPHNFRALRLVIETVIQNTIQKANNDDDDDDDDDLI